jgi:hypothetical protein
MTPRIPVPTRPINETERAFGVESVTKVLDECKTRASHRHAMDVERMVDLNLHWEDEGPKHSKSGFFARIDGADMRLTNGAMKTLNRLIKGPMDLRHWEQYEDKNAFPKAVRNILDNNARRSHGVQLIHNELEVQAFLPSDYQVRNAYDMLSDYLEQLDENIGDIRGINAHESGYGDHCSYRVVMGDNIMPSVDANKGQYMMFTLSMSENGQCDARTGLGTYRTICTNSAIHEQTLSKWNHKSGGEGRFYENSGEMIRLHGMLQSQFKDVFENYFKAPLEHEAGELLNTMKAVGAISKEHFEATRVRLEMPDETGSRQAATYYDLFNGLTAGAKDMASIPAREQAEQAAMTLFTAPGGLYAQLKAFAQRKRLRNTERLIGLN